MLDTNKLIIQELIKTKAKTPADLAMIKRKTAKKYKISCPSNIALLKDYHKMKRNKNLAFGKNFFSRFARNRRIKKSEIIENLLITRPIRSLSGIVNVSVLTNPYPCPGKCIYCPQEKGIPKSYLSGEPAVERAKRLNYDPYLQTQKRLEMLETQGHPIDKIELRIIGGTWSFYPKKYQTWFVKKCFDAANQKISQNLEKAQNTNEKAKHRIIGLSIETRPDFIDVTEIKRLRKLGATMVELGVQSIYAHVLKLNLRGHKVKETILATKLLKDAGFKVLYQMMPNLFGSNLKKDAKMFEEIFQNPDFQPDLLKIYPCALLRNTLLYQLWQKKKYKPYTEKQLIELVKCIKKKIPYYVRIQRITRDIPAQLIIAGPAKISNLRQIIARELKKEGKRCKCIRCREIRENYNPKEKIYLFRQNYNASQGKEIFLSYENKKRTKLYSLLRLRISKIAIIRELHTYGQMIPISEKKLAPQHKGLGKKLVKQAEKIIKKEFTLKKIAVISGVGVRMYWRKLGYKLKDTFMVKSGKF